MDIIQKKNFTVAEVKKILMRYQTKINNNMDSNKKTLIIVYYGGHGMMKDN